MEDLIHAIYVSSAAPDISEHDTVKFLNEARKANRKNDVSGMMLYICGCFLQLLEGEATKVDIVCRTIFRDKREMRMILREPITEREFPEWTMGFEAVAPLEAARLLGEPLLGPPRFRSSAARRPVLLVAGAARHSLMRECRDGLAPGAVRRHNDSCELRRMVNASLSG
jgi:hypothetical protein